MQRSNFAENSSQTVRYDSDDEPQWDPLYEERLKEIPAIPERRPQQPPGHGGGDEEAPWDPRLELILQGFIPQVSGDENGSPEERVAPSNSHLDEENPEDWPELLEFMQTMECEKWVAVAPTETHAEEEDHPVDGNGELENEGHSETRDYETENTDGTVCTQTNSHGDSSILVPENIGGVDETEAPSFPGAWFGCDGVGGTHMLAGEGFSRGLEMASQGGSTEVHLEMTQKTPQGRAPSMVGSPAPDNTPMQVDQAQGTNNSQYGVAELHQMEQLGSFTAMDIDARGNEMERLAVDSPDTPLADVSLPMSNEVMNVDEEEDDSDSLGMRGDDTEAMAFSVTSASTAATSLFEPSLTGSEQAWTELQPGHDLEIDVPFDEGYGVGFFNRELQSHEGRNTFELEGMGVAGGFPFVDQPTAPVATPDTDQGTGTQSAGNDHKDHLCTEKERLRIEPTEDSSVVPEGVSEPSSSLTHGTLFEGNVVSSATPQHSNQETQTPIATTLLAALEEAGGGAHAPVTAEIQAVDFFDEEGCNPSIGRDRFPGEMECRCSEARNDASTSRENLLSLDTDAQCDTSQSPPGETNATAPVIFTQVESFNETEIFNGTLLCPQFDDGKVDVADDEASAGCIIQHLPETVVVAGERGPGGSTGKAVGESGLSSAGHSQPLSNGAGQATADPEVSSPSVSSSRSRRRPSPSPRGSCEHDDCSLKTRITHLFIIGIIFLLFCFSFALYDQRARNMEERSTWAAVMQRVVDLDEKIDKKFDKDLRILLREHAKITGAYYKADMMLEVEPMKGRLDDAEGSIMELERKNKHMVGQIQSLKGKMVGREELKVLVEFEVAMEIEEKLKAFKQEWDEALWNKLNEREKFKAEEKAAGRGVLKRLFRLP